ncbi:MAG TPA: hypothetical protein VK153_02980 [Candidatus Paceibacterota bacterium]|nr:hypothetical protein [Candidatus Paceibacterota bacterium]
MKLISSIIFIVISLVIFFVFIDPLYGEIKQLRADVSAYNIALSNSTELQKTRDSLINVYKEVKAEDKDRLAHFLPSSIGNIDLILEIEKIANLHGMPIGNIKFDPKNLESNKDAASDNKADNVIMAENDELDNLPYGIFPMEFIIEGRYETFLSFLKELEQNLRLVDIKSVSFRVPQQGSGGSEGGVSVDPNVYSYTLKVETYWLK